MDVLREASPLERAYIGGNIALYFYFTLGEQFDRKAYEHALALVMRRHPFLRAAVHDTVFIEKDGVCCSEHITEVQKLPQQGEQFTYALDSSSLFHLYISFQEDGSTECLLVLHHSIGDVTAGISLIEDIVKGLLTPQIPQSALPVHTSIETFFPYMPTQSEVTEYSQAYHNTHVYPATCTLTISEPSVPFEQTLLHEKVVTLRKDIYERMKKIAKHHQVSRHALLTSLLLHAIPQTQDRTSVCIGTSVDMKRRLLEGQSQKDLFAGAVTATSFIDLNGQDSAEVTAAKYAGALAAKIQSPDLYREVYGILDEKVNLFLLGMSFFISDAGIIHFSSSAVQEMITHLSFTSPIHLNCPSITTLTYDNTVTLRIIYPTPWITNKTIDAYIKRLSHTLSKL